MAAGPRPGNRRRDSRARDSVAARLASLRGILALEQSRGFDNSAVAGGLDLFIENSRDIVPWLSDLFDAGDRSYAGLNKAQRRAWAAKATARASLVEGSRAAMRPANAPARRPRRPAPPKPPITLDTPLAGLPFVSRSTQPRIEHLGVSKLRDLLYLFPNRHVDYSNITPIAGLSLGDDTTVIGKVTSSETARIGRPPGAARVTLNDSTGLLNITWWGQAYLASRLKPGTRLAVSGRVSEYRGRAQMENPEYEELKGFADELVHAGNLLPVYPSTEGLQQRTIRNAARKALDAGLPLLADHIPQQILRDRGMPQLADSLRRMHFPKDEDEYKLARQRMAFDELFVNQVAVLRRKREWAARGGGVPIERGRDAALNYVNRLEFELTGDQKSTLEAILEDIDTHVPMGRMLQGEVGSGKTVVALAALLATAADGRVGAFMAPTEVLAEQHFLSATRQLDATPVENHPENIVRAGGHGSDRKPVTLALLTGSLRKSVKSRVQGMIADGEVDIVIGTHALLQDAVSIPRLALVVIDEQHKFGVGQRAALTDREPRPHLLAMSATPIPRSLALTVYGDLELSTLRQMPGGRKPITTKWAKSAQDRRDAYVLARREIAAGRQVFIVCPFVEESDQVKGRAATVEFERLRGGELASIDVGLLHGRMSLAEKLATMDSFRDGETQALVATPVIEVGVDVSNATVMLIESADRFGMAQLHQLRGRVGRGSNRSYCVLLADDPGADGQARLSTVERIADGFELAEVDLETRGPGEYLGARQSGWPELKVANVGDRDLLALARADASDLLASDPNLENPAHEALSKEVTRKTPTTQSDIS